MERIRERLSLAGEVKLPLDIPQFARYLGALDARATAYHDDLTERHRVVLGKATETLFGPFTQVSAQASTEKGGSFSQI